jgi:RNA polymerase sigma-B factor
MFEVVEPSSGALSGGTDADALFRRYRSEHDSAARDRLVERYLPLARHLARRYRTNAEQEDLEQVASIALLKAIDRFDPERGIAFTSFAVPTILGELKRYFRDFGWAVRVPRSIKERKHQVDVEARALSAELGRSPTPAELAERIGSTVEQVVEALAAATAHRPDSLDRPMSEGGDGDTLIDVYGGGPDPGYTRSEDAVFVDSLLARLSERERVILRMRFHEDLTQAEIGHRLGLSQMHISRLIREAIAQLQDVASRP